jgi:hypothetical protein
MHKTVRVNQHDHGLTEIQEHVDGLVEVLEERIRIESTYSNGEVQFLLGKDHWGEDR